MLGVAVGSVPLSVDEIGGDLDLGFSQGGFGLKVRAGGCDGLQQPGIGQPDLARAGQMTAHPEGELVGRFHLGRQMLDGNLLVSAECSRVRTLGYVIASALWLVPGTEVTPPAGTLTAAIP